MIGGLVGGGERLARRGLEGVGGIVTPGKTTIKGVVWKKQTVTSSYCLPFSPHKHNSWMLLNQSLEQEITLPGKMHLKSGQTVRNRLLQDNDHAYTCTQTYPLPCGGARS